MAVQIQNSSDGTLAGVSSQNQLRVVAESHELQHQVSFYEENTYQVLAIDATVTATTDQVLHIKNTSATKKCVITYIRMQAVTDITVAEVTEYWSLILGDTVASGGSAGVITNMNASSGKVAEVTATIADPSMDGVGVEIDRYYPTKSGDECIFNKHGAIVLGLNDTLHIAFTSGAAAGHAKARITFSMMDNDR